MLEMSDSLRGWKLSELAPAVFMGIAHSAQHAYSVCQGHTRPRAIRPVQPCCCCLLQVTSGTVVYYPDSLDMSLCVCLQPYGPYQPGPWSPPFHPGYPPGMHGWPQMHAPMYGPMPFLQGPPPMSPQAAWQAYGSPQYTQGGTPRPSTPDPYYQSPTAPAQRPSSPWSSHSSMPPPSRVSQTT